MSHEAVEGSLLGRGWGEDLLEPPEMEEREGEAAAGSLMQIWGFQTHVGPLYNPTERPCIS